MILKAGIIDAVYFHSQVMSCVRLESKDLAGVQNGSRSAVFEVSPEQEPVA
jgi:hypothetical protein